MPPSELILTIRPAAGLLHEPRGVLAAEEDRLQVDGVDEVPILFGDVERVEPGEAGGVVDQPVEAAQAVCDFAEEARDLVDFLQVGAEDLGAAAFGGCAARFGLGAVVVDGDAGALLRQAEGDAAADAFGGAGDEDDAAGHATGLGGRLRRMGRPGGLPHWVRELCGGFAMDFDLLGLDAFALGLGETSGQMSPAPE